MRPPPHPSRSPSSPNPFDEYGDLPFVHWHHYERVHIEQYVDRFGDRDGIAARVLANLLDLLPITKNAIALPLPSYSLKVVEEYVGFQRTQDEYGGSWAKAQFILATETEDEGERNQRMGEILKYNEEDLAATWAVFEWLRRKTTRPLRLRFRSLRLAHPTRHRVRDFRSQTGDSRSQNLG